MIILNLKTIEYFISNYKIDNKFIVYLKVIFTNLYCLKEVKMISFLLEEERFVIEFEFEEEFFKLELDNNFLNIQIDSIEKYYVFEHDSEIKELVGELFNGNYVRKYFIDKNEKVKFLKLIWKNKKLKRYNFKYRIGMLKCKNKIENISVKNGIVLTKNIC